MNVLVSINGRMKAATWMSIGMGRKKRVEGTNNGSTCIVHMPEISASGVAAVQRQCLRCLQQMLSGDWNDMHVGIERR